MEKVKTRLKEEVRIASSRSGRFQRATTTIPPGLCSPFVPFHRSAWLTKYARALVRAHVRTFPVSKSPLVKPTLANNDRPRVDVSISRGPFRGRPRNRGIPCRPRTGMLTKRGPTTLLSASGTDSHSPRSSLALESRTPRDGQSASALARDHHNGPSKYLFFPFNGTERCRR